MWEVCLQMHELTGDTMNITLYKARSKYSVFLMYWSFGHFQAMDFKPLVWTTAVQLLKDKLKSPDWFWPIARADFGQ